LLIYGQLLPEGKKLKEEQLLDATHINISIQDSRRLVLAVASVRDERVLGSKVFFVEDKTSLTILDPGEDLVRSVNGHPLQHHLDRELTTL
jgi:hypothetical protein